VNGATGKGGRGDGRGEEGREVENTGGGGRKEQ